MEGVRWAPVSVGGNDMSMKIAAVLSLVLSAVSAIGCSSGPDLQGRIDELTREQEEMQRQKEQSDSELAIYKAKCEAMERNRSAARPSAAPTPSVRAMPAEPEGIDIRKRGNDTVINLPSDVFFASGSATLNAAGERTMVKVADYIKRHNSGGL